MTTTIHSLYGGEVSISFADENHRYKCLKPGPERVLAGVTSKTGILDKPALKKWYLQQAVGAFKKLVGVGDFVTEEVFKSVCDGIMNTGTRTKEKAGDIGKDIHDWISNHIKSETGFNTPMPIPADSAIRNCVMGWLGWEAGMKANSGLEWVDSERLVYSREHDAVGTLDEVAIIQMSVDDTRMPYKTLFDVKTGSGIYEEYWLQIGGYWGFYNEEMRFLGEREIDYGQIIRLDKKTGAVEPSPLIGREILEELYDHFLETHSLYNWKYRWSKQLKELISQIG